MIPYGVIGQEQVNGEAYSAETELFNDIHEGFGGS